ncbi:NAD(P)/FAD-dependent oxidoreductase [Streptomyces sp. AC512_CC834]|uniref:NAD(P)/FAD-dependent oxidoreductase n=1 Tax=Streptomyces sp. AC512_CC834 TaxID=2823691 RepID=UPI001C26A1A7|nr:FAD-dependent monooxygenase [Streptomyces sp. AC512_CC834]
MSEAVVIGGGLAGLLAARVLSRHADRVTVIEGDTYPDGPQQRKGLPQGRQNHMLMAGGAEALDQLLPGTVARLTAAGAHTLRMGQDMLTRSSEGWFRTFEDESYTVACSRPLIDHVVRSQVLGTANITFLESTKAVGLTGDANKVTGVCVERADRSEGVVSGDLVVDASGNRSKASEWLAGMGLPTVKEEFVDAGLTYAGREFEAPAEAAKDFPGVLIQAVPGTGRPGKGAAFMPQEDGRWIVSLIGTQGGQPPTAEEGFMDFARDVGDPVVADIISTARPLTPVRGSRGLANRRRHYHKLPVPDGFLALGDAVMVLSPNYATGMSMAAFGALALRTRLKTHGLEPGLSRKVQDDVAKAGEGPWTMASTTDLFFPGVKTNITVRGAAMQQSMGARYSRTAAANEDVLRAVYEVSTLRSPQSRMMSLPLLAAVLRGPGKPPLTPGQAKAQFPQIGELFASGVKPDLSDAGL